MLFSWYQQPKRSLCQYGNVKLKQLYGWLIIAISVAGRQPLALDTFVDMADPAAIVYLLIIAGLVFWVVRAQRREKVLVQKLEKRKREREAVYRFLDVFGERITTGALSVEPALETLTSFVAEQTDAEAAATFILDPDEGVLSARVIHGVFPPLMQSTGYILTKQKYLTDRVKREKIQLGEGIIGQVAQSNTPVLIKDAALDPRVPKVDSPVVVIRTMMVAPLLAHGKTLGVLAVVNKRGVGAFQQEELELLVTLADQAASTVELVRLYDEMAEKQRLEQELKLAHDFQQMLLPKSCPQPPGFEIAAFSAPALEVGGDYYDFIWIDDDRRYLGIAIADVSGKGIPGGLIMAVVRCTMRANAPGNLSPRDVLIKVNERVYADTRENVFVTITYGILDTKEKTFRFARAGHEPVVMVGEDGEVKLSSPLGMAMGLVAGDMFQILEEETIDLEAADTAIFYTDGVVEAMDPMNNEYGQNRFFDLIATNRKATPQEIIKKTLADIKSFTKGHPQHDDITMLAIRTTDSERSEVDQTATMASVEA